VERRLMAALSAVLGVLALVGLTASASPAAAQEGGATVIGSVLDTSGSPVEGATITVSSSDGGFSVEATSDAQGTFIAEVPGPGDYRVTIDPGSVPSAVTVPKRYVEGDGVKVTVPEGEDSGSVTIELRRAESLRGTMSNAGEPLPGVQVTVTGEGGFSETATTNEQGVWEVFVPEPGNYTVSINPEQLPEGVDVREGTKSEITVQVFSSQQRAVLFAFGESQRHVLSFTDQALQLIVEGIRFGLLLALAALGLSLIFGTTGLVNFAHGEMIALGAIIAWALNVNGIPFIWAALITVVAAGLIGGLQEVGLWRPLRRRKTGLIAMMIVTIGLSIFARFLFLFFIGAQPRSYDEFVTQAGIQMGPISLAPRDIWSMAIALIVLVGAALLLIFTRIGKAMRAVSDNPSLAAASGIDVNRVILFVWVTGGALAGLGGILLGLSQQVKFDMGFDLLLLVFAGVILGGLGTAFGALVGSLVVGLFVTVSTLWIPSELKNVAALAVLILILLFRPQGILGRAERVG
jgi:neutral amino acid transport system permease protein